MSLEVKMWSLRTFLVAVLAACAGAVCKGKDTCYMAPDGSSFRKDYVFYPQARGWLKLHMVPANWYTARRLCQLEGAHLASPLDEGLLSSMRTLQKLTGSGMVYTGVGSIASGSDYFSVEGVHFSKMPIEWATGEPNNLGDAERCLALLQSGLAADVDCSSPHAFLCYREKTGLMTMNECGTYDKDYVRHQRSCYKFHSGRASWRRAHTVCTAEGARLAVINSEEEAKVLLRMARSKPQASEFVFVGIYNWYRDDEFDNHWVTVDGNSLHEVGFARWRHGEPNNFNNSEYCGCFMIHDEAVSRLELLDLSCDRPMAFICEIMLPS